MLDEHMGPIKKYSILTVGAVVLALANYVFKFPNHFSFGGVAGFAVILSGMFGGSASTYTFVINMLLLLIAFPILGKEVAMRSFYVSIVFRDILLHGCVQRRNRYYCFDIKKVYECVNWNGIIAGRLRSCCDFFLCI